MSPEDMYRDLDTLQRFLVAIKARPELIEEVRVKKLPCISSESKHVSPELLPQIGHFHWVTTLAYSRDGRFLVSGGDSTLRLWDAASGNCLRVLEGHNLVDLISCAAFSPDGRFIVSGSYDKTIRMWDVASGKCLRVIESHDRVICLAYSPDGRFIVSGSGDLTLRIYKADTSNCIRLLKWNAESGIPKGLRTWAYCVAYSPDGRFIVSGGMDAVIRVWDAASGNSIRTMKGHGDSVKSIVYSPDGHFIASGSRDATLRIWDAASGKCLKVLKEHVNTIESLAFSSNGHFIVSGCQDSTVRFWDPESGNCIRVIKGDVGIGVFSVACSPDSRFVISGNANGSLHLLNANNEDYQWTRHGADHVNLVAYAPDGHSIVSASKNALHFWNRSGEYFRNQAKYETVSFSPDGLSIFSKNNFGRIKIWDAANGEFLREISIGIFSDHVVYSPDCRFIVSCTSGFFISEPCTITRHDAISGECLRKIEGDWRHITSVVYSPDGRFIAFGSTDNNLRVWDGESDNFLHVMDGHTDDLKSVAYSPDGRFIASGSRDATLRIWDAASGICLQTLNGHSDWVNSIVYSPDGRFIVSGSRDATLRIWDAVSGKCLRLIEGHGWQVNSVAYSPDGRFIISGSDDGTVRFWVAASGLMLACLYSFKDNGWVVLANDGRYDSSDCGECPNLRWAVHLKSCAITEFKRDFYTPGLLEIIFG